MIQGFRIFHCIECGKCTGACPLAQVDMEFSPRLIAKHAIEKGIHSDYVMEKAWTCLTCGLCHERCLQGIPFADFIRTIRPLYYQEHARGHLSHGGALQSLMRMQAAPDLKQNRLEWLTSDLKVSSSGKVLYFVGCLSYFDLFFSDLNVKPREIAVNTIRILNRMGIEPVVLADERCCGHDLIWTGDEDAFKNLRELNLSSFRSAGIKTIITACGECSYVLRSLYPDSRETFPYEVMHLSEFLKKSGFSPDNHLKLSATYQDPCRLGRFQNVYNAPRGILGSILDLREMRHYGTGAWCCGNSSWLCCNRYSKQIQVQRLLEAKETGSDMIITACPKCYIHLSCTLRDVNRMYDFPFKIKDFSSIVGENMERGRSQ